MSGGEGARTDPPLILAIAGTGQNGATLLSRMLGEVRGVVAIGEIGRLWDKGLGEDVECSCGQRFSACPFWSDVGARAYGGWDRVDAAEARRLAENLTLHHSRAPHAFALPLILIPRANPRFRRDLEAYAALMAPLYQAVRDVSGADLIVDAMKIPAHVYLLATRPEFNASFVHLVRDPRGVAFSKTKVVPRQGSRPDKPIRTRRRPRRSAFKWLWFNGSSEILRLLGHPFIRVRYEDLVRDPGANLRACLSHAGYPVDEGDLAFLGDGVVRLSPGHLVAGNRMRNESGDVHLRVDEAWRDRLPEREQRRVALVTRPLLRRYGYG